MKVLRRLAHACLLVVGFPLWLIGVLCFTAATYAAIAGEKLMPGRMFGNCWTFALPRYVERGGCFVFTRAMVEQYAQAMVAQYMQAVAEQFDAAVKEQAAKVCKNTI